MPTITYHGRWEPGHTYGPGALVRRSDGGLYLFTGTQPQQSTTLPADDSAHWSALVAGTSPSPPPPPPALFWTDDFTRPDQGGWGTASGGYSWIYDVASASTASIAANEGLFTCVDGANAPLMTLGPPFTGDRELLVTWTAPNENCIAMLLLRVNNGNSQHVMLYLRTGGNVISEFWNGSSDDFTPVDGTWAGVSPGTYVTTRVRLVGQTIWWKNWAVGDPEPAAFQGSHTGSVSTSGDYVGLFGAFNNTGDVIHYRSFDAHAAYLPWTDTFTRANQSGSWGTASGGFDWGVSGGDDTMLSIASDAGLASGSGYVTLSPTGLSMTDGSVLIKVRRTGSTGSVSLGLRVDGNNQYYGTTAADGTFALRKLVSGADTGISSTTATFNVDTDYWMRFQVVGTALELHWYADGDAEIDGPGLFATVSSVAGPGAVQVSLACFGASYTLHSFAFTAL